MTEDIIIFGRGAYWHIKKEKISQKYNVIAILDNNAKSKEKEEGIPVVLPSRVNELPDKSIYIMVSRQFFIDVALQLSQLGVRKDRILFGVNLLPCFDKGEEVLHLLHGNISFDGEQMVLDCDKGRFYFSGNETYQQLMRYLMNTNNGFIESLIKEISVEPFSRNFGLERGKAIDRYYIESFLKKNVDCIKGVVLEIGGTEYTRRFGKSVDRSYSLHVENWGGISEGHIHGNLETGFGIPERFFDCLICTQTIQMIYDIHSAMKNIYSLLKPGGVLLITGSGISQISRSDNDNWGEYWRFTKKSMFRLVSEVFPKNKINVETFGNVKTTIGFLYGLSQEDLVEDDYSYNDEQYPLVVVAKCSKPL